MDTQAMVESGYVATIGMFDGVHRGHQFVLQQVIDCARQHGLQPLCITFDHSPRSEQVLTPLNEKLRLIQQVGIKCCEVLHFTPALKALTAREFMEKELKQRLGVRILMTGYDNRFGHNREEGFDDYVRYGKELGIEVLGLPAKGQVSSSYVRQQLLAGDVSRAAGCLGHPYSISGPVVHGEHIGSRMGFPTANIVPEDANQLIPANGVYAIKVRIDGTQEEWKGMMNIGTRPTFGKHMQTLEAHLLHYSGNLYAQHLTVDFISKMREECHFDSPEALQEQLKIDALQAESLL